MLSPVISENIDRIKALCQKHRVKKLYVFGSAARNELKENSDIDFLIEFEEIDTASYADNYFAFLESLNHLLKREIDLVTEKYLRNRFFIKELNETKQMLFAA